MRHIIFLLTISLFAVSCGQNSRKQKELELKERELALKEKELNLKERDSASFQNTSSQTETSFIGPGYYKVINDKTYFFDAPDLQTKRNSYILRNDEIEVHKSVGYFGYAVYGYKDPSGKETKGWLLLRDLRRTAPAYFGDLDNTIKDPNPDYSFFVGKWADENGNGYTITFKNKTFLIETFFNPNQDDYEYIDRRLGIVYEGKLKNGIIEAKHDNFNSPTDREILIKKKDDTYITINSFAYSRVSK